jgi:hypothetical protein
MEDTRTDMAARSDPRGHNTGKDASTGVAEISRAIKLRFHNNSAL